MTLVAIDDRSRSEATLAVAAAWIAFMAGLMVGGDLTDPVSVAIGGVSGAALVFVGFAAAWRCRTLHRSAPVNRLRLTLLSLAVGATLGLCNLAANWTIAAADPRIRAVLVERMATLGTARSAYRLAYRGGSCRAALSHERDGMGGVARHETHGCRPCHRTDRIGVVLCTDAPGPSVSWRSVLANYYRAALMTKYTPGRYAARMDLLALGASIRHRRSRRRECGASRPAGRSVLSQTHATRRLPPSKSLMMSQPIVPGSQDFTERK